MKSIKQDSLCTSPRSTEGSKTYEYFGVDSKCFTSTANSDGFSSTE